MEFYQFCPDIYQICAFFSDIKKVGISSEVCIFLPFLWS